MAGISYVRGSRHPMTKSLDYGGNVLDVEPLEATA